MSNKTYDVVAVTACPTGIAHTFMAAQAIEDSAKALGYTVKVETQGTEGSQNALTEEEIKNAKAIILAVDRNIEMDRFNGMNVLSTSTSKVIKNADLEINNAIQNKGTKIIKSSSEGSKKDQSEGQLTFDNFGGRIWKSIMTGVSFMLPFVVFGGILIAISFLIDINNAGSGNFGSGNDVALWFNTAGGMA
ncbi:MAG: fructose permease IIC protein, partial [Mycoplasmataceae bacterium]|nr:fructose permease IIC protein [Mycoplasmataceae bacterium]